MANEQTARKKNNVKVKRQGEKKVRKTRLREAVSCESYVQVTPPVSTERYLSL
jgi:hypothetical protein